ncbi:MAG: hypothetical protein RLZZ214_1306, partial [Verrucomicrobiota bacterium]
MRSGANKECGHFCPHRRWKAKQSLFRTPLSHLIGKWTKVSTLLIAILLAASHASASEEALQALGSDLARFEKLLPEITDESYRRLVTGVHGHLKGRAGELRSAFDQAKYDDVKLSILVETQRVLAWLNPPPVSSLSQAGPPKAPSPVTVPAVAKSSP